MNNIKSADEFTCLDFLSLISLGSRQPGRTENKTIGYKARDNKI